MTSLLWKFCHYGSAEARDEAYQEILERGEVILPELIKAVEEELQRVRGSFGGTDEQGQVVYPGPEPLERLIKLLVTYDNPSILFPLAWVAAWRYEKIFQELFFRVYTAFEARSSPDDIAAFINTLTRLKALRGTKAQQRSIAFVLVRMAENDPKPELRAALPLLRPGLSTAFEFAMLYKQLKATLDQENLPIPATAGQATQDLPIPTDQGYQNDR